MKRMIITAEEQYIKVFSPCMNATGFGFFMDIPEEVYFDEPYINEKQKEELLCKANKIYEGYKPTWQNEPRVEIYWRTLSKDTINI